jgi:hypothetical protein
MRRQQTERRRVPCGAQYPSHTVDRKKWRRLPEVKLWIIREVAKLSSMSEEASCLGSAAHAVPKSGETLVREKLTQSPADARRDSRRMLAGAELRFLRHPIVRARV